MNKPAVILVHGIKSDGYGSIFNLKPFLEQAGFEVYTFQYPHNSLMATFSKEKSDRNASLLHKLVDRIREESGVVPHVVFHSNGARVVHRAMEFGAKFSQAYGFAPAFGAKTIWPRFAFTKMNIITNVSDWALWRGGLIPRHDFGHLGIYGYLGIFDARIHSISNHVDKSIDRHNHSHMWKNPTRLQMWSDYLIVRLEKEDDLRRV